jgi:hypothetical protein
MISLTPNYARLFIDKQRPFDEVTESMRSVLQICRVNGLPAAIVISEQDAFDWRSSLRVALRFIATRWGASQIKLGLVVFSADPDIRQDVRKTATDAGFDCKVFDEEADAVRWVTLGGGATGPRAS